jgi:hypothetical protein
LDLPVKYIGLVLSLSVGSSALAWSYSRAGLDSGALILSILGVLWLIAYWRRWRWFAGFGLLTCIAFAAYGLWISLPPDLMILGALGGLFAWDLQEFTLRLRYALPTEDVRAMEARHMWRLMIVALAGLALAGITKFVRLHFTWELVFGLVLLSAVGLIQLARWLESRGE